MKINNPELQSRILEKTLEFIAARGVKGWNTAELARETGVAKNTLYKMIGSKEKLVEQVVLAQMRFTNELIKKIIREEADYRPAIKRMLREAPAYLARQPRVALAEILLEYPSIAPKLLAYRQEVSDEIRSFILKGMNEGHLRSDVTPEFINSLLQGIIDHFTHSGLGRDELESALKSAFMCLREGMRLGDW